MTALKRRLSGGNVCHLEDVKRTLHLAEKCFGSFVAALNATKLCDCILQFVVALGSLTGVCEAGGSL